MKTIELLESKFKVKRNNIGAICAVVCKRKDLRTCLKYINEVSPFSERIRLKITNRKIEIIIYRNSFSGRAYIDENKSHWWNDENYPYQFNDNRIFHEILDILNSKKRK